MAPSQDSAERSYYRIPTVLPVRCRVIHAHEAHALEAEIAARTPLDLSSLDLGLRSWLARIEDKLDRILAHFETEEGAWITREEPLDVVLSGGGLQLPVLEEVEVGSDTLVELTLPGSPKLVVRAIARVARCDSDGKEIRLALHFRVISEGDRAAVVGHVLELQRSQLRRRSGS